MRNASTRRNCGWLPGAALFCALTGLATDAAAQSSRNVAVVINDKSPDSQRIGEYYARVREIPPENVIRIQTLVQDGIARDVFVRSIEAPIASALRKAGLQDRILYIVLTKGIPLRVEGTDGIDGTTASVDSELVLLYRKMSGREVPLQGRVPNPFFAETNTLSKSPRFSRRAFDLFLVTRLDGFTADDAIALVDRARAATKGAGRFVLDQRGSVASNPLGDVWLAEAARRLTQLGLVDAVTFDRTREAVRNVENVLGYYAWASSDPQNRTRQSTMRFAPGALAATFGSGEARTFREPPADWKPTGNWKDRGSWFEGAPEVLSGDLVREGVTGLAGHVADPFLQSAVRPDILFPAYVSGLNLAESFYAAMPHVGWRSVVLGDPLCSPFQRMSLSGDEIESPVDEATELPGYFSKRRVEAVAALMKGAPAKAIELAVRAETRLDRGDRTGAAAALEEAVAAAPDQPRAVMQLALVYETDGKYSEAATRYEQLLKLQPNNAVALNNLAYSIAVRQKDPARAKPLAERALSFAPREPTIADTLAWIEHLLGNAGTATKLIAFAVRGAPANAEVRLHAAFILEASAPDSALTELKAALQLDPSLAERSEVKALEGRLVK